jgi:hypothetical protein
MEIAIILEIKMAMDSMHIDRVAQRYAVQPPQAQETTSQNSTDLARDAVGCNGGLACGFATGDWERFK